MRERAAGSSTCMTVLDDVVVRVAAVPEIDWETEVSASAGAETRDETVAVLDWSIFELLLATAVLFVETGDERDMATVALFFCLLISSDIFAIDTVFCEMDLEIADVGESACMRVLADGWLMFLMLLKIQENFKVKTTRVL